MNKNKKYLLGIGVLLVVCVITGVTYAYWMLTFTQTNQNTITTDCFKITFVGENDINLQNAYPMSDSELYSFYGSATPYHFTITNTCDAYASGVINLETLNSTKKLADDYVDVILYEGTKNYLDIAKAKTESSDVYSIKGEGRVYNDINIYDYSLKSNPVNANKLITDALTAYKLHEFTLSPLEVKEFHLLEYMNPETPVLDEVMNATFESKITVTTSHQKAPEKMNKLKSRGCLSPSECTDTSRVFQTDYIKNATSIIFEKTTVAPTTYEAAFDESEAQDGSIMAYVVANEDNPSKYTIRFQTDGKFLMPEDSSYYFDEFSGVTSIEGLENVDTSQVTNMSYMFTSCRNLTSLDLSSFDTSNVTDMSFMFPSCSSLTSLDLSSFDTSNVTNMSLMFASCSSLTSLDLSSFNTSKVTNMSAMFPSCSSLTSLDLSSFDTSNVTDMSGMFNGCSNLTSLNVSSFDTSNVTDMNYMFYNSSSLSTITYGVNFIRKSNSNIDCMYVSCPANKPTDPSWNGAF